MIFAPNIIITQDADYIAAIQMSKKLSDLPKPGKDTFLSFTQNKYIYSLVHEFNFNGEAGQAGIEINVVDTDGLFEQVFFNESLMEGQIRNRVKELSKNGLTLNDITSEESFSLEVNKSFTVTIAYGIGDNLDSWSRPGVFSLISADFEISNNGLRSYSYKFVPIISNLFLPPLEVDPENSNPTRDVNFGAGRSIVSVEIEVSPNDLSSISDNVYNLLKLYVGKLTDDPSADNVITILPKFNKFNNIALIRNFIGDLQNEPSILELYFPFLPIFEDSNIRIQRKIIALYKTAFNIDVVGVTDSPTTDTKVVTSVQRVQVDVKGEINDTAKILRYKLILSSESKSSRESIEDVEPQTPNLWGPINQITLGLNTPVNLPAPLSGASNIPVVVDILVENNLDYLNLFHKFQLIKEPTKPAIFVGDRQMIKDLIYLNAGSIESIDDYTSVFNLTRDSEGSAWRDLIDKIQEYKDSIKSIRRRRTSSSFSEQTLVDELLFNQGEDSLEKIIDDDIPVFTNNTKNSNILTLSVKNSNNYFANIQRTIRDNRAKYIALQLDQKVINEVLEKYQLSVQILKDIYNYSLRELNKIPEEERLTFNEVVNKKGKIRDFLLKEGNRETGSIALDSKSLSRQIKEIRDLQDNLTPEELSKIKTGSLVSLRARGFGKNLPPIIFSEEVGNISLLNKLIQRTLGAKTIGTETRYTPDELIRLSELAVVLNESTFGDERLTLSPGVNQPNDNFIIRSIYDYMLKYSYTVTLKTLPFFHLSNLSTITKPSFLKSFRLPLMGAESSRFDDNEDPFNGLYIILGFRHTISNAECSSEFYLQRNFGGKDLIKK
jgi:hypothetical protein